jgi:surface protein
MKKLFFAILSMFFVLYLHSNDFITKWRFDDFAFMIRFNAQTQGGAVEYTWTANPSGNHGTGSFANINGGEVLLLNLTILPGDTVTLSMKPENLRRFYMNTGTFPEDWIGTHPSSYSPDRLRLSDVAQWGNVPWSSMQFAFWGCARLNISAKDIPNLSNVNSMINMFRECTILNSPVNINNWDVSNVNHMRGVFADAISFNQPLDNWDVSKVTNMSRMFFKTISFNQPIATWNTDNVENMSEMFAKTYSFNQSLNDWNTGKVNNMSSMFMEAEAFNQPLDNWNTSRVTIMYRMFMSSKVFNQNLSSWNTSAVINFESMFELAQAFNGEINGWNTSSAITFEKMFKGTKVFNQSLNNWDTRKVTNMVKTFQDAEAFNKDISNWNTSNVNTMYAMFNNASVFNQDLSKWDTRKVLHLSFIFLNARAFNQDLGKWKIHPEAFTHSILEYSGLDCENYSATLIGWYLNNPTITHRNVGVKGMQFGKSAANARNRLISERKWIFNGDSPSNQDCGTMPDLSLSTTFPSSSQIVFYPNPSSNILHIQSQLIGNYSVVLYQFDGKKVLEQNFETPRAIIDMSNLTEGIYQAVILLNGVKVENQRIVKINSN